MSGWQPLPAGVTWRSPTLAAFTVMRSALEARFGAPQFADDVLEGVGRFDCWCLRFACDLELCLWTARPDPCPPRLALEQGRVMGELLSNGEVRHALHHLGVPLRDLWRSEQPVERRWRVQREDESGNRFEVALVTSRCEAEALASAYEGKGHKQRYWCEAIEP